MDSPTLTKNHKEFLEVLKQAAALREKKMHDYGLSYQTHGSYGLIVRLTDKMQRLCRLGAPGKPVPNFESMEDTAIDILNYAGMLVMELRRERHENV
jgi:hypothetical protein